MITFPRQTNPFTTSITTRTSPSSFGLRPIRASPGGQSFLIGRDNGSCPISFRITINGGVLQALRRDSTCAHTPTISGSVGVLDNQWHHVALVKEGSALRLYRDGGLA